MTIPTISKGCRAGASPESRAEGAQDRMPSSIRAWSAVPSEPVSHAEDFPWFAFGKLGAYEPGFRVRLVRPLSAAECSRADRLRQDPPLADLQGLFRSLRRNAVYNEDPALVLTRG